jgi:hypothetical protein
MPRCDEAVKRLPCKIHDGKRHLRLVILHDVPVLETAFDRL